MNNLINVIIGILKVVVTALGLLISPFLHGLPPIINSVETALHELAPVAQSTQVSKPQTLSRLNTLGRYRGEHVSRALRSLPTTPTSLSQQSTANVLVKAGDKYVTATNLRSASQIINSISLPTLNSVVGLSPASQINVVLFSSAKTYGNALLRAGINSGSIQAMISDTGGVTVGTTVWIPLYNLEDKSDLANVLSHELFHACTNSQGYGEELPTWINEGTAWRIGLIAQQKVDPQKTSDVMAYYAQGVKTAAQNGTILSLNASEKDILNSNYNVEYEDFMAVEQLTKSFGVSTYKTFIENLKHENINSDFENTFHISMSTFQNSFLKSLKSGTK